MILEKTADDEICGDPIKKAGSPLVSVTQIPRTFIQFLMYLINVSLLNDHQALKKNL